MSVEVGGTFRPLAGNILHSETIAKMEAASLEAVAAAQRKAAMDLALKWWQQESISGGARTAEHLLIERQMGQALLEASRIANLIRLGTPGEIEKILEASRILYRQPSGLTGVWVSLALAVVVEVGLYVLREYSKEKKRDTIRRLARQAVTQAAQQVVMQTGRAMVHEMAQRMVDGTVKLAASLIPPRLPIPGITVGLQDFNDDLNNGWKKIGNAMAETLRQQTRQVVRRCINYTPPFSGKQLSRMLDDDYGRQTAKGVGQERVRRDIERVFIPVNKLKVWKTLEGFAAAVDKADSAAIAKLLGPKFHFVSIGREPDKALYWRQKNSRGNVRHRPDQQLVLNPGSVEKYIKERQRLVGYARSGWNTAAQKFGFPVPGWIKRHNGPGVGEEHFDQPELKTVIGNNVPYIQEKGRDLKIMELAISAQARSYQASLRKAFREAAAALQPQSPKH